MGKREMIASVRDYLSLFGKVDERILRAMINIDRKKFMPFRYKTLAYIDSAISIGYGQTISQPSTVARMLSLLNLKEGDFVLEIGTGSAWNVSLISCLIRKGKVISLEVVRELAEKARKKILDLKLKNVEVREEDFRELKDKFDKIIFTAGISKEQEKIIEDFAQKHLKEKGILICPYQSGPLIILRKERGKIIKEFTEESYGFVPLVLNAARSPASA